MIHTATQIFTHQLLISSDSFFPSPSITLAIFFHHHFSIHVLPSLYHLYYPTRSRSKPVFISFFYQETASDPTNSNHLNPSAFFIMVGSEAPSICNSLHPHHQLLVFYIYQTIHHIVQLIYFTFFSINLFHQTYQFTWTM
jgi:hypothetical protein